MDNIRVISLDDDSDSRADIGYIDALFDEIGVSVLVTFEPRKNHHFNRRLV